MRGHLKVDVHKDQKRGEVILSSKTRVVTQVVQQVEKHVAVSWSASANGAEDRNDTAFSLQPSGSPLATGEGWLGFESIFRRIYIRRPGML
jgi:hypothetical protein